MKNTALSQLRSRADIMAEIQSLPPSVQGTISSYTNIRKDGTKAVYYNLQYTHRGKNHSFAIPVGKVDAFKEAVKSGRRLKELILELSMCDARSIASAPSPLKKTSRVSSSRAQRESTRS